MLNVGDEVDAKVVAIDSDARKMNLSIKALIPEGEKKKPRKVAEDEEESEKPEKRTRAPKRTTEEEDYSEWEDAASGSVGISIGDILAAQKNK